MLVLFILRFLDVLSLAMLLRAILGWFVMDGQGKFMRFLFVLTEPVVLPIRKLFYKLNWFQGTPIDMAFTFSWFALYLVEVLITAMVRF